MRPALSACLIAHNDIIAVHLMELGSEAQKQEWPPRMATDSGEDLNMTIDVELNLLASDND